MSLPRKVQTELQRLTSMVDEGLQAEAHTVASAVDLNEAFRRKWVESDLTRAIIVRLACSYSSKTLTCAELPGGGAETTTLDKDVERRFRWRRAVLSQYNRPVVMVNSDSMLNPPRRDADLFGYEPPPDFEQWVLAYVMDPRTRAFSTVFAGRVVDKVGNKPPYRLVLADVEVIPHAAPLPPGFKPQRDDDLDIPGEEEGFGEQGE